MSDIKFRPRFRIETTLEENEVAEKVKNKLNEENPFRFESTIIKGHLILKINKGQRHFWSPQMDVSLNPLEEGQGTLIRCLLAPEPAVWTMFMFFYTIAGFAAFVGLMIAMSQWTLERDMWGLWLVAVGTVLGIVLFFIAQFGKKIARAEMESMKSFLTDIHFPEKKA
jgi:hypothetical protein